MSETNNNTLTSNTDLAKHQKEKEQAINKGLAEKNGQPIKQYIEYTYRWVIVCVYTLAALFNAFPEMTFAPISQHISRMYGVSLLQVNLCTLMYYLAFPIATFVANWAIDNVGTKFGVSIGNILLITGTGLRLLIDQGFFFVIIGQFVSGLGSTFLLNPISKISASWFKPENRAVSTVAFSFASLVSGAFGAIISPEIVGDQSGKKDVMKLLWIEFVIMAAVMGITLVLFKGKPKTPPTISDMQKREDYLPALKSLATNRNYLLIIFSMSCFFSAVSPFFTVINTYLSPFNFSSSDAGLFCGICTLGGVVGNVIEAIYLKKTKNFKKASVFGLVFGTLVFASSYGLLLAENKVAGFICFFLVGMFLYPVIAGYLELSTEIAFPVGEATANGFLWAISQLCAFLVGILLTNIVKGENKKQSFYGYLIFLGFFSAGTILMILCKEIKNRENLEKQAEAKLIQDNLGKSDDPAGYAAI